jgi:hypothetical protein
VRELTRAAARARLDGLVRAIVGRRSAAHLAA